MGQCFQAGVNYFDNAEVYAEGAQLTTAANTVAEQLCMLRLHTIT